MSMLENISSVPSPTTSCAKQHSASSPTATKIERYTPATSFTSAFTSPFVELVDDEEQHCDSDLDGSDIDISDNESVASSTHTLVNGYCDFSSSNDDTRGISNVNEKALQFNQVFSSPLIHETNHNKDFDSEPSNDIMEYSNVEDSIHDNSQFLSLTPLHQNETIMQNLGDDRHNTYYFRNGHCMHASRKNGARDTGADGEGKQERIVGAYVVEREGAGSPFSVTSSSLSQPIRASTHGVTKSTYSDSVNSRICEDTNEEDDDNNRPSDRLSLRQCSNAHASRFTHELARNQQSHVSQLDTNHNQRSEPYSDYVNKASQGFYSPHAAAAANAGSTSSNSYDSQNVSSDAASFSSNGSNANNYGKTNGGRKRKSNNSYVDHDMSFSDNNTAEQNCNRVGDSLSQNEQENIAAVHCRFHSSPASSSSNAIAAENGNEFGKFPAIEANNNTHEFINNNIRMRSSSSSGHEMKFPSHASCHVAAATGADSHYRYADESATPALQDNGGSKRSDSNSTANSNTATSSVVSQLIDEARALNERLKLKSSHLWVAYGHARNVLTRYRLMHELEQCHKDLSFGALRCQNPASRAQLITRLKAEQTMLYKMRKENESLKQMLAEYENAYHKVGSDLHRHDMLLRILPQQEHAAIQHFHAALAERAERERSRRQVLEHYAYQTVASFEQSCRERMETLDASRTINLSLASALDIGDRLERLEYLNSNAEYYADLEDDAPRPATADRHNKLSSSSSTSSAANAALAAGTSGEHSGKKKAFFGDSSLSSYNELAAADSDTTSRPSAGDVILHMTASLLSPEKATQHCIVSRVVNSSEKNVQLSTSADVLLSTLPT